VVVGVNKMDLLASPSRAEYQLSRVRAALEFMGFAPLVPVSVKTGKNLPRIFTLIDEVYRQYTFRVGTSELNRIFGEITAAHSPPRVAHRAVKFYYATQAEIRPPTFIAVTNFPGRIPESYRRYVVNQLRERLGLPHAPVQVHFKGREKRRPPAGGSRRKADKKSSE
jgi:GTP-binding protein